MGKPLGVKQAGSPNLTRSETGVLNATILALDAYAEVRRR
jgi:hypothetical protein